MKLISKKILEYHGLFNVWNINNDTEKQIIIVFNLNKTIIIQPDGDVSCDISGNSLPYTIGNRKPNVMVSGVYDNEIILPKLLGHYYHDRIIIIADDNINNNELLTWIDDSNNESYLKMIMKNNGVTPVVLFKTMIMLIKANNSSNTSNQPDNTVNVVFEKWLKMFLNILSKTEILYKEI